MFKIRNLILEDLEIIIPLEEQLLGETVGKELLASELHNRYAHFYVGTIDEKVIGYLSVWMVEETVDIINFVIDEQYQHQGYGQALFKKMEEEAYHEGCSNIMLEVKAHNYKAQRFYEKAQFVPINLRKNYYKDGEDAIIMKKVLI